MPDVATFTELKFPDVDVDIWYGLFTSKNIPQNHLELLQKAISISVVSPEFLSTLPPGLEPIHPSKTSLVDKINKDRDRYKKLRLENN